MFSYVARDVPTSTMNILIGDIRLGSSLAVEHLLSTHEGLGQISSTAQTRHGSKHW